MPRGRGTGECAKHPVQGGVWRRPTLGLPRRQPIFRRGTGQTQSDRLPCRVDARMRERTMPETTPGAVMDARAAAGAETVAAIRAIEREMGVEPRALARIPRSWSRWRAAPSFSRPAAFPCRRESRARPTASPRMLMKRETGPRRADRRRRRPGVVTARSRRHYNLLVTDTERYRRLANTVGARAIPDRRSRSALSVSTRPSPRSRGARSTPTGCCSR